jgi:hypothetical protein
MTQQNMENMFNAVIEMISSQSLLRSYEEKEADDMVVTLERLFSTYHMLPTISVHCDSHTAPYGGCENDVIKYYDVLIVMDNTKDIQMDLIRDIMFIVLEHNDSNKQFKIIKIINSMFDTNKLRCAFIPYEQGIQFASFIM